MDSPSISDVAREAGVSKSTVSRVLNNRPNVVEDKRRKVLAAADRLGFRINPVIASIAMKRFKKGAHGQGVFTALLTRSRKSEAGQLALRLKKQFAPHDLLVEHFDTLQYPDPATLSRTLRNQGVVLLVLHRILEDVDFFGNFDWFPFVAITLDQAFNKPQLPLVREAQTHQINEAISRMRGLGYAKIGGVFPWWKLYREDNFRRIAGWQGAQCLLPPEDRAPLLLLEWAEEKEPHVLRMRHYLERNKPDAMLLHSRWAERRLEEACTAAGLPPIPMAFLRADESTAGFRNSEQLCFEQAAVLAHQLIRSSSYGLQKLPPEILLSPDWSDAPSLPRKGAACPMLDTPLTDA